MRALGGLGVVVALVAVGVAGGILLGRGADTVTTVTMVVTDERAAGIPSDVEATRGALLAAAKAHDYAAIGRLLPKDFRYTFGLPVAGGAVAYWKKLERQGEKPLETLAAILEMPPVLDTGYYTWPFAYALTWDRMTAHEKALLAPIARGGVERLFPGGEGYYGWRTGIAPDGTWTYFVSGD